MKKFYSTLLAFGLVFSANAQTTRCASDEMTKLMLEKHPEAAAEMARIDQEIADYESSPNLQGAEGLISIPVVVHVVYKTNAQNISDAQIESQIAVLNEDFRALNSDTSMVPGAFKGDVADSQIEFCLAKQDPQGNATNGIVRTQTTVNSFSNDDVKDDSKGGSDPWPRNQYLNIWVCNLSGGILGYAYQPGAPASIDGVVIGYNYFGSIDYNDGSFTLSAPYNLGRTATHEVGHWLDLDHVWGGGSGCASDNINDTPLQDGPNFGCPSFPTLSNCSGNSNGPDGDMFMNYMDYVNDACMHMFSRDQAARMDNALLIARASIRFSPGCQPGTPISTHEAPSISGLELYPNPANDVLRLKFNQIQETEYVIEIVNNLGQVVYQNNARGHKGEVQNEIRLDHLPNGLYHLNLQSSGNRLTKEFIIQD